MNKKRQAGLRVKRMIIAIIFLAGAVGIAFFPFLNRNLTVYFVTDETKYGIERNNEQIANGDCNEIVLEGMGEEVLIEAVRIYAASKSTMLKEIRSDELLRYIELVDQGQAQWTSEGIVITGVGNIHLIMNEEFVKMMQELSATFLQERIFLLELYSCIAVFLFFIYQVKKEKHAKENWNNHGPIFELKQFWKDMKQYRQYMVYAARTDLKAEVANSYLNRLWWLLEPFFNMIVYVIVFGNIMGNSIKNYATFIFSALLMWNFFSKTINFSVKLVRNSKDIITKVYIPKYVLLLSDMILNMFKLMFSVIVLVVMMIVFRVQIGLNIFFVIPAYAVMLLLAFGVGMLFLHFGVYVDDLSYAVGILLNMLMFLSGIFYNTMTTLPEPLNGLMMSLNPLAVVIDTMRNALLYNTAANLPALGIWFVISIILCCVGVHTVYKNENSYVKIV